MALLFAPIVGELEKLIKASLVVYVDETPYCMKLNKRYDRAYFWPLLAKDVGVAFRWTDQRNAETAALVLEGIHPPKTLVTDGLNLYDTYCSKHNLLQQVCWSPIRRKFDEALISNRIIAEEGLAKTGLIFKTDKELLRATSEPKIILEQRATQVAPLVTELLDWSKELVDQPQVVTNKTLRIAFNNLIERELESQTFLTNHLVKIHNNDNERESKNFKLGVKNWLFASFQCWSR